MNQMTDLKTVLSLPIPDTQSARDERHLAIQRVGVKDVRYPVQVRVGGQAQPTVAQWDLDVALPAEQKGTHMSRFVAWLDAIEAPLDAASLRAGLAGMLEKLHASEGRIEARFPFFIRKRAPGVGPGEPAGVPRSLDGRDARRRQRRLGRGGGAGEVAVPLLEGNLGLRRPQPAFARDTARRSAG